MRKRLMVIAGVIAAVLSVPAFGQDQKEDVEEIPEVVISATRTEKPADEVSGSISVITREDIENEGESSLEDLMRRVPGVDIVRTGGPGSDASIYIRGGRSEHTLVMVDGVEIHDPISTTRVSYPALISLDGIERIEVIRGPAGPVYGSDALAGVVHIITRKGEGPPGAGASVEGGSFNSWRESADVWGSSWKMSWYAGASSLSTDGISAADEEEGNSERDGFELLSAAARVGIDPAEWLKLEVIFHGLESTTGLDAFPLSSETGLPEDDPNYETECSMYLYSGNAELFLWDGRWRQKLVAARVDHRRDMLDETDDDHPDDSFDATYLAESLQLTWQHDVDLMPRHRFSTGIDYREETGEYEYTSTSMFGPWDEEFDSEKAILRSVFAQWDYHRREAGLVIGVRSDNHDTFGSHISHRVGGTYLFESTGTRFKASAGTGFSAPSIFQMYYMPSPWSPPPEEELEPELSDSLEAGIIQSFLDDRVRVSATYFDVFYEDMIDWDSLNWTYMNVARARSRGYEVGLSARPLETLEVVLDYSDVDAKDLETDEPLIRRSGRKYSGSIIMEPTRKFRAYVTALHVEEREDQAFILGEVERVELDPYTLLRAGAGYMVLKGLELSVRGENILDEHYQESYGYGTMPASFYAGVSYTYESGTAY